MLMDEEFADATNDPMYNEEANFQVKTSLDTVKLPPKSGNPAFSIHADKVYILYPSLFQDPNIFGRFSIPQTINLDPVPQKNVANQNEPQSIPPSISRGNDPYPYQRGKRQAGDPVAIPQQAARKKEAKKRNVESHLSGSIVVLNQDVNEYNQKESYWIIQSNTVPQ